MHGCVAPGRRSFRAADGVPPWPSVGYRPQARAGKHSTCIRQVDLEVESRGGGGNAKP